MRRISLLVAILLATAPSGAWRQSSPVYAQSSTDNFALSPYMDSAAIPLCGRLVANLPSQVLPLNYLFAVDQAEGIRWAYFAIDWSDIETAPGIYNWSNVDAAVAAAHAHGVHLMIQVDVGTLCTPSPPTDTQGFRTNTVNPFPPTTAPRNLDGPVPFWKALAARYMPGGQLAVSQGWADGYGVTYFEVENEPTNPVFASGSWNTIPRDYGLYLSIVKGALNTVSTSLKVIGGVLSSPPASGPCCDWLTWMSQVLTTSPDLQNASDQYRSAVANGTQPIIGAGPSIDAYSFHDDVYDPSKPYAIDFVQAYRATVQSFSNQAGYPTTNNPVIWMTEGSPPPQTNSNPVVGTAVHVEQVVTGTGPTNAQLSWWLAQLAVRYIANGVQRVSFNPISVGPQVPTQGPPTASQLATDPRFLAAKAMTSYFPSYQGVQDESSTLTTAVGQPVVGYKWVSPDSGLASNVLWAPDEPTGSGATGPAFNAIVPVVTPYALIISSDWSQHFVKVTGGTVTVPVQSADPSGVALVVESNTLNGGPCHEGDGDGHVADGKGGSAHVHFDQDTCDDGTPESVQATDPTTGDNFTSSAVTGLTFNDSQSNLTVAGTGTHNGAPVTFSLVAQNGAAAIGAYALTLSDGYQLIGPLLDGSITLATPISVPSYRSAQDEGAVLTAAAGHSVVGYKWPDLGTGLVTNALWAPSEPKGSGLAGPVFDAVVPVATPYALIINSTDWSQRYVTVTGGSVAVSLQNGDPSPVTMVVESNTLNGGPTACHEADGDGHVADGKGGSARVQFDQDPCDDGSPQSVQTSDPTTGDNFASNTVTAMTFNDVQSTITLAGTGIHNGMPVAFTLVAQKGAAGVGAYSLTLADGYRLIGTLTDGQIAL